MSTSYTMVSNRMNTQRSKVAGVDVMKEAKAANENGISRCTKTLQFHHPTQHPMPAPMQMAPPHYHPPHQYPHGQFPGYPMYPMMPYSNPHPQVYGYHHQYHPMNANMMRRPYAMTPAFAKPHTSSAPPDMSSSRSTPNGTGTKAIIKDRSSALIGKKFEETSHQITPTVSAETLAREEQPEVIPKDKGTMGDSKFSVQESTPAESKADTAMLKQESKLAESDAKVTLNAMSGDKHRTVSNLEDACPQISQTKDENQVSSSSRLNVGGIPPSQNDTCSILQEHSSNSVVPQHKKSDSTLGAIDSLAFHCVNANERDREGVESLLLLSRVAENVRSSEDSAEKSSIEKQKSAQNKPLKKRKLQLPMRADRQEEGPLPKRKPAPSERTPAFFHFLLHHKEAIEKTIFSAEDTSYGLERSERVAKEGAIWWMASSEEEKQRWANISTHNLHDILQHSQ